jgi:hypothetical protein
VTVAVGASWFSGPGRWPGLRRIFDNSHHGSSGPGRWPGLGRIGLRPGVKRTLTRSLPSPRVNDIRSNFMAIFQKKKPRHFLLFVLLNMSKVVRTYEQECGFVEQIDATSYRIKKGFVENMRVPGHFYVNESIRDLLFEELRQFSRSSGSAGQFSGAVGGFLPAMKQIANVAALPGIVGRFF